MGSLTSPQPRATTREPVRADPVGCPRTVCGVRYWVAAQTWAPGQWSGRAFAIAIIAILLVGLGLLILAYMVIVKPAGTLTVTYQRAMAEQRSTISAGAASTASCFADRLAQLDAARDAGLLTPEEYAAKRAEVIASL